jgi:acylphosphatase
MEMVRVRVRVRGRVQGVWYRGSTREQAAALGVTGWVRNAEDGSVELEAQGPPAAVHKLVEWCRRGPPGAKVESVDVDTTTPEPTGATAGFAVRR